MLDFMTAVTGWDYSFERLMKDGERIATLRHLFNLREGINPLDRPVPHRSIGEPPQKAGPLEDVTVDLQQMLADYYDRVGWDLQTSMPSDATLQRLGLKDLVDRFGWGAS